MIQEKPQVSVLNVWTVITPLQLPQMFKATASIFCHECNSGICLLFVVRSFKNSATGDPVEQGYCTNNDLPSKHWYRTTWHSWVDALTVPGKVNTYSWQVISLKVHDGKKWGNVLPTNSYSCLLFVWTSVDSKFEAAISRGCNRRNQSDGKWRINHRLLESAWTKAV